MTKRELRQQIREFLAGIPAPELSRRSALAVQRLCAEPEYRQAATLMLFLSMPQEIDTTLLALEAWRAGKRVLAPRVFAEERNMIPIEISSISSGTLEGYMGVREPVAGPAVPVAEIDLLIVPGLAFDACGNRLGRGRGFYDRFLARPGFRAVTCALALDEQFVPQVPCEPFDVAVNMLVTDSRVLRFPDVNRAAPHAQSA